MHRKTISTARDHASLAAFLRKHLGVEYRDDLGPLLGQAAMVEELRAAETAHRSSRRKIVAAALDEKGMLRRVPRHASKHASHKRSPR